jgi:hypothetical protein
MPVTALVAPGPEVTRQTPGLPVRGVGGSLLVTDQHVLDLLLLVKGIVDVQDGPARVAENVLDTLLLQALDKDFGAIEFHLQPPSLRP